VGYSAIATSGAAAAMQPGLARILTGQNEEFIQQLPDLTGMKSEVIIQKLHRNPLIASNRCEDRRCPSRYACRFASLGLRQL
jgi:hypothetical protein